MKAITQAIINVMQEVKGIEKDLNVGTGNYSYKGVGDQQVKKIIGDAMAKNGLAILPIKVDAKTQIDRWQEDVEYKGKIETKTKQQVLVEVETKYLLLHVSGESIELAGYGQGVDNQDKAAGKATTYALKYCLLYSFLIPTGKIDDADNTHSNDYETPKRPTYLKSENPPLRLIDDEGKFTSAYYNIKSQVDNGDELTIERIEKRRTVTDKEKAILKAEFNIT